MTYIRMQYIYGTGPRMEWIATTGFPDCEARLRRVWESASRTASGPLVDWREVIA